MIQPNRLLSGSTRAVLPSSATPPPATAALSRAARKPPVRPRLSPASAGGSSPGCSFGSTPAPPAQTSPEMLDILTAPIVTASAASVNNGCGCLAGERESIPICITKNTMTAATASAAACDSGAASSSCTPPAADLAIPSTQMLTRALLQRPRAAPVVCPPLHSSPLPPVPNATTNTATTTIHTTKSLVEGTLAGEKRVRPALSAGSLSAASGAAPAAKRAASDPAEGNGSEIEDNEDGAEFDSRNFISDSNIGGSNAPAATTATSGMTTAVTAATTMSTVNHSTHTGIFRSADEKSHATDAMLNPSESPMLRTQILTDEVLRDWTECEDLGMVLSFEVRLDAEVLMGVHEMSRLLPSLIALRLSRSHIPRIRLLGTCYTQLQRLWINNCRVEDLRGLGACAPRLVELYASFNNITDLTPLLDVSATLEVLDVEGNRLADVASLGFVLPSLSRVTALSLGGNDVVFNHAEVARALAAMQADLGITTRAVVAAVNSDVASVKQTFADAANDGEMRVHGFVTTSSADVLRGWIQLLMPQLETLDDVAMLLPTVSVMRAEGNVHTSSTPALTAADAEPHHNAPCPTNGPAAAVVTASSIPSSVTTTANTTVATNRRILYTDPTDTALSAELRLLQECVRANDGFYDRVAESLERHHSGLYSRPSTSCASGARRRIHTANGGSVPGSRLGSASASRCPAAFSASAGRLGISTSLPTAAGAGAATAATNRVNSTTPTAMNIAGALDAESARSDLTTGSVLAGSAIASLRRRLQQQQQQHQSPRLRALGDDAPTSGARSTPNGVRVPLPCGGAAYTGSSSTASTDEDRLNTPPLRCSASLDVDEKTNTDAMLGTLATEDEDEAAWDVYKAAVTRERNALSIAAAVTATSRPSVSTAFANTRYRQLYAKYFPEEAVEEASSRKGSMTTAAAATVAAVSCGAANITADVTADDVHYDDAAVDALVRKEILRERAQMAILADVDAESEMAEVLTARGGGVGAWGNALSASGRAAPPVVLHQPDVLNFADE